MSQWQLLTSVLLLACSIGVASADSRAQEARSTDNSLPEFACRFTTRVVTHGEQKRDDTHEWYLWRQAAVVERRDVNGESGQIWRRDKNDQVSYQRVFHTAKRTIDYYPGDLRSLRNYPEWRKLASLLDPTLLGSALIVQEEVTILDRQAHRYLGQVEGQELEVLWLVQEQLPARVQRKHKEREEVLELKEIYPLSQSPWLRNETAGYESIDYADLGDKESDPFVRALLYGGGMPREHSH